MKPTEEQLVIALSQRLGMPAPPKPSELGPNATRVDRELKRMMGEQPSVTPRPPQVITAADIERAKQARHAGHELGCRYYDGGDCGCILSVAEKPTEVAK